MSTMLTMAALLAMQGPVAAPLAPTGKWTVEYAQNMCVLSRDYGAGEDKVTLGFRLLPMSDTSELVLMTPDTGRSMRSTGRTQLTLLPSERPIPAEYQHWLVKAQGKRVTMLTIDSAAMDELTAAGGVRFATSAASHIDIAIRGAKPAIAALDACQDDLLKTWGIDPAERTRIGTKAGNLGADWISTNDYPNESIRQRAEGTSTIVFTINTIGRIEDCRIVMSSGNPPLDAAACAALVRRVRVTPARGKDGKPMATHGTRRITWRLPE